MLVISQYAAIRQIVDVSYVKNKRIYKDINKQRLRGIFHKLFSSFQNYIPNCNNLCLNEVVVHDHAAEYIS